MLKQNSKRILDIVAGQKTRNATKAYQEVHPSAKYITARANSYELLKKPEAQIYLQTHINRAKETVVQLLDSEKDDIKLRAADSILDRSMGKAIQRSEVNTTGVTLNIDLTGVS